MGVEPHKAGRNTSRKTPKSHDRQKPIEGLPVRKTAFAVFRKVVEERLPLEDALAAQERFVEQLDARERRFLRALVMTALRHAGTSELGGRLSKKF